MVRKDRGFSMLELLVVVAIIAVIAAFALPNAINFLKAYRLHADASAVASQLNVTRFRATSQFRPYRLTFDLANNSFAMEVLAPNYTAPTVEFGPIQSSTGITYLSSCPVSARPGTIPSSFSGISSSMVFNTRGLPVDGSGAPTNNSVIYLTNDNNQYDAVTVTLGGRITIWGYSPTTSAWVAR